MNAERLLALYDRVCEAPDAIPRLRRFILDLAVRGRLVEQDPNHEPATELLKRITIENSKRKEDRRKRTSVKAIDRSEAPFVIPSTWVWVPLGFVTRIRTGKLDANAAVKGGRYPFFTCSQVSSEIDSYSFDTAAVLLAGNGDFNLKCYEGKFDAYQRTYVIEPVAWDLGYCFVVLRSQISRITDNQRGSAIPYLKLADISDPLIPLPPLPEQHRIVSKVDELMALCDSLEAERKKREATRDRLTTASLSRLAAPDGDERQFKGHADFAIRVLPELTSRPDQIKVLRQTILDLAVRGKLVEQDPNDEPASESLARLLDQKRAAHLEEGLRQRPPVAKPTRLDLTFEFPVSWDLTCFDDVFVVVSGITKGQRVNPQDAVEVPYLRVANVQRGYLDLAIVKSISVKEIDVQRYQLRNGDILMTEGGDWDKLGRAAIWQEEISHCIHQNHIFRLRPPSTDILPEWVVAYANSPSGRSFFEGASKQTTNLASINMTQLRGCPLPLPPLAEQYRIVTKVNQLMMFCEQIEKARTTESNRQIQLLEALLLETMQPMVQRAAS